MNCTGINEATFKVGGPVDCEIDIWQGGDPMSGSEWGAPPWSQEMVEELAIACGMTEGNEDGDDWDNMTKAFEIICQVGADSQHFVNDPKIEAALDLWREQDNTDDISEPSYFTQWDQSLGGTTWVSDGALYPPLGPVLLTPEMLEQNDKLNILWDEGDPYQVIADQLVTLEVLAVGDKHGVAKCAYGGVFLTKGTLTYLRDVKIGDKFKCWITFTNAKYPWRTVVNGVVN